MTTTVLTDFLRDLIDYAGLFPPAGLDMTQAVANYARYRDGAERELLGRFVVNVARLTEFEAAARQRLPRTMNASRWQLSALPGGDWRGDLERIVAFNAAHHDENQGLAEVSAVELKPAHPDEIGAMAAVYPSAWERYFEVPLSGDLTPWLAAIAAAEGFAKVRSGGVTPDAIPSLDDLAGFLVGCREHGISFKATAGLHHPVRAEHTLTYEPDSPRAIMHGFLNVFVAAALLHAEGIDRDTVREVLAETDLSAFDFAGDGLRWRQHALDRDELIGARRRFAHSFGSCSFEEPIDDLQTAELL